MITAKIIADSVCSENTSKRITSFILTYPRFIHAELLTHRAITKSSASSRAIPVTKFIEDVLTDPALPVHLNDTVIVKPFTRFSVTLPRSRYWLEALSNLMLLEETSYVAREIDGLVHEEDLLGRRIFRKGLDGSPLGCPEGWPLG